MSYKRLIISSMVASLIYSLLVVILAFALMFSGIGVLFLPQPFIAVHVSRWTINYDPLTPMNILWLLYIFAIHCTIYYLLENVYPIKTGTHIITGLTIFALNLLLVTMDSQIILCSYM